MNTRRYGHRGGATPDYNLALLGEIGVGKSALTVKYITRRFIMEYDPDIEDTYTKQEDLDGSEMSVHIMDTCDKENSDQNRYLRWADAYIIVYSITDRSSFERARTYLQVVKTNTKDLPVALVGNKIDLERYRQVSKEEGNSLAGEFDCLFYETTAAEEFEYVEDVFHGILHEIRERADKQLNFQPLFISEEKFHVTPRGVRPKSPKITADKKDDKATGKKNTSSFKLFNKSFKIFN